MVLNILLNWPIVFNDNKGGKIPETFVNSSGEKIIFNLFGEPVKISSGFMEPSGHGDKGKSSYAIFANDPNNIVQVPSTPVTDKNDNYNIGIDYVVQTPDKATRAWYSGVVEYAEPKGSYGNRVRIKTDVTYNFNGKEYTVYTAYAHLDTLDVKQGDKVSQGESVGQMGGTGKTPPYPQHVDLQTWIEVDGKIVNVSPNLLQEQLVEKAIKQFSEPILDIIQQQLGIPPGLIQEFWQQWQGGIQKSELPGYALAAEGEFNKSDRTGKSTVCRSASSGSGWRWN